MFHVGQKVVLVGWLQAVVNTWLAHHSDARYPNVGDVYTVRAIAPWKDSAVLLLHEIDNSHLGYNPEPGFRQEFFRPAVEPKADISFAHEILRTTKAPATALALSSTNSGGAA